MRSGAKSILFYTILALLFLPMAQGILNFFDENPLLGAYTETKKPHLTIQSWHAGGYQDSINEWVKQNAGFHPTLVRLHNQLDYAISNEVNVSEVVVGKNGYLFQEKYIRAYLGQDYKGEEHWQNLCARLKRIQDTLAAKKTFCIVAMAPGKATFFPEFLPDSCSKPSGESNYKSFVTQLKAQGINHIDFMEWFLRMKKESPFPLYPRGGIHWSNYGSTLAADSLIKYLQQKAELNLPSISIVKSYLSDTILNPDNDISDAINLLFPITPLKMARCDLRYENKEGKQTPVIYTLGDSYFWQFYNMGLANNVFEKIYFNYYNNTLYTSDKQLSEAVPASSAPFRLPENSIVLFLITESNLSDFPWNFFDTLESSGGANAANTDELASMIEEIKKDQAWLDLVTKKAKEHGVSLEEMLRRDAEWTIKQRHNAPPPK